MIHDFKQVLAKVGLKDNEIDVYLACLKSEAGLAIQTIANQTKIKRSTVNLILERLLERGFLSFYLEGKRRIFQAEPPEQLLFNLQETTQDFKGIIPFLSQQKEQTIASKVRFYEGEEEIKRVYADIILSLKYKPEMEREVLEIASGEDIFRIMPDHDKVFIAKRIKERIRLRWLAPKNDKVASRLLKTAREELREIKFFDESLYPYHIDTILYGNRLMFTTTHKNPAGIIIENKDIAQSFRSVFNMLWDSLRRAK